MFQYARVFHAREVNFPHRRNSSRIRFHRTYVGTTFRNTIYQNFSFYTLERFPNGKKKREKERESFASWIARTTIIWNLLLVRESGKFTAPSPNDIVVSNGFRTKLDWSEHWRNLWKRVNSTLYKRSPYARRYRTFLVNLRYIVITSKFFLFTEFFYVAICVHINYELQKLRVGDKKFWRFKNLRLNLKIENSDIYVLFMQIC